MHPKPVAHQDQTPTRQSIRTIRKTEYPPQCLMISEEIKLLHLEIRLEDLNSPYDGQSFFLAGGVVLLRRSELSAPEVQGGISFRPRACERARIRSDDRTHPCLRSTAGPGEAIEEPEVTQGPLQQAKSGQLAFAELRDRRSMLLL